MIWLIWHGTLGMLFHNHKSNLHLGKLTAGITWRFEKEFSSSKWVPSRERSHIPPNMDTENSYTWKEIHFKKTIIFGIYVRFRGGGVILVPMQVDLLVQLQAQFSIQGGLQNPKSTKLHLTMGWLKQQGEKTPTHPPKKPKAQMTHIYIYI